MPLEKIPLSVMEKFGRGLDRPEDVVVSREGRVFASDQQSAVAEILSDGSIRRIGEAGGAPNGMNMDERGRIIIANFGIYNGSPGPLQRLDVDSGEVENLVDAVDGLELTSSNYPIVGRDGTIWCTHSTFAGEWPQALDGRKDGFVYSWHEERGASGVLADGLMFANGCCLDEAEEYLYVNQTSGGNVVRFALRADGSGNISLGEPEPYGPVLGVIPDGPPDPANLPTLEERARWAYTDGNGFDEEGNLWVTLPAANKIVAITSELEVVTIAQDIEGGLLNGPTNVSWGGEDMRDLYIGSLYTDYVIKARSPTAGLRLAHQR